MPTYNKTPPLETMGGVLHTWIKCGGRYTSEVGPDLALGQPRKLLDILSRGRRVTVNMAPVGISPVRELVSLQRRCATNPNQMAIHANIYGVYPEEIKALQKDDTDFLGPLSDLLVEL